jgi:hypothetical protein
MFIFYMKIKNVSDVLKHLKRPRVVLGICLGYFTFNTLRFHFSERYRTRSCLNELKERFEFSGKFVGNKPGKKRLCTIYPSNSYDVEKLLDIANNHGVAILNDINDNSLPKSHIRVDFSKYNKITNFDPSDKVVTVEPGVKLSDLIIYLSKYGYTIPKLEMYQQSELTVRDVLFNNYYNFIDGDFIDNIINQLTVIIPRGNRFMKLKQNDDLNLSDLNLKSLFLRSNSTLGIITEAKFNIKKCKPYKFIGIENIQNNLLEVFETLADLKKAKAELGLKDIIVLREEENITKIMLKVDKERFTHCETLLKATGLHFTELTDSGYYKNLISMYNGKNIFRRLKVRVNKTNTYNFLKKIEKYTNDYDLPFIFKGNTLKNEMELIIKNNDNSIESIEKSYDFIDSIHNWTRKKSMNIFGKLKI